MILLSSLYKPECTRVSCMYGTYQYVSVMCQQGFRIQLYYELVINNSCRFCVTDINSIIERL